MDEEILTPSDEQEESDIMEEDIPLGKDFSENEDDEYTEEDKD